MAGLLAEAMGKGKENWYPNKQKIIHQGDILVADITSALRQLPVEDWRGKHDEWLELLIACKHIGVSLADFTEWCVSDPHYANDGDIIARKWHSVEPKHGGALWRELSKRKIRVGQGDNELVEVPITKPKSKLPAFQPSRLPDARLNYICNKIAENPTERALFSWACLAAEIVHECKRKPTQIVQMLYGATIGTALWETLGKEGIRRTIANAFSHVEQKILNQIDNPDQRKEQPCVDQDKAVAEVTAVEPSAM